MIADCVCKFSVSKNSHFSQTIAEGDYDLLWPRKMMTTAGEVLDFAEARLLPLFWVLTLKLNSLVLSFLNSLCSDLDNLWFVLLEFEYLEFHHTSVQHWKASFFAIPTNLFLWWVGRATDYQLINVSNVLGSHYTATNFISTFHSCSELAHPLLCWIYSMHSPKPYMEGKNKPSFVAVQFNDVGLHDP